MVASRKPPAGVGVPAPPTTRRLSDAPLGAFTGREGIPPTPEHTWTSVGHTGPALCTFPICQAHIPRRGLTPSFSQLQRTALTISGLLVCLRCAQHATLCVRALSPGAGSVTRTAHLPHGPTHMHGPLSAQGDTSGICSPAESKQGAGGALGPRGAGILSAGHLCSHGPAGSLPGLCPIQGRTESVRAG